MRDEEWLRRSFMVTSARFDNVDMARRELTEAQYKYTDTTLGGNFAINPPPQFTRFADVPVPSRYSHSSGQGRYYSEALDDRGQYVHMRFGVPEFNSLVNFFFNFYNAGAGHLANRGRAPTSFYYIGRATGFVVSLPVQPLIWTGQVLRFFSKKPASKFYYLKPTMPLYWSAVSTMLNGIGVNMGVIGRGMTEGEQIMRSDLDPYQGGEHGALHSAMEAGGGANAMMEKNFPNIYRPDGGIDIYKVATRAQRMAIVQRKQVAKVLENGGSLQAMASSMEASQTGSLNDPGMRNGDLGSYLDSYHGTESGTPENPDTDTENQTGTDGDIVKETTLSSSGDDSGFADHLLAELEDGAAFVTFRVDDQGPVSESFSNQSGESSLASTLKGVTSSARQAKFSFANGNLAEVPVIGDIVRRVGDFVRGGLEEINMSGLLALGGEAFADIPKVWEDSSVEFPTASYTIELRSPYGSPRARFQNLIVPLCMLLAAAMPRATGKQSYTSPFLCELYSQGRQQIRLGVVESLSITRGTGNVGWTRNGEPLGIDVSFTVADLSSIMSMPISSNFGVVGAAMQGAAEVVGWAGDMAAEIATGMEMDMQGGASEMATLLAKSTFDDDNAYTDYLAVLGSLGLADQIYPTNKLRLNRARRLADWQQWKSPAHHANWMAGTQVGRIVSAITRGTDRN